MSKYETLIIYFVSEKSIIDEMTKDLVSMNFEEWINDYESSRCTWVDDWTCVVTSDYNMEYIKEWFFRNFEDYFNYCEEN